MVLIGHLYSTPLFNDDKGEEECGYGKCMHELGYVYEYHFLFCVIVCHHQKGEDC